MDTARIDASRTPASAEGHAAGPVRFPPKRTAALAELVTRAVGPRDELSVKIPFTGAELGRVPRGAAADVREAADRARTAQPAWAGRPYRERASIFLRFHDLLLDRRDEALDLIQLESGKARLHALEEVLGTAAVARHYALRAGRLLRPRRRRGALPGLTVTREFRRPVGVVGFISPWNFPLILALTDAIPALLAGNAAVLRPDPQASFTALWAMALLREAGLPEEVLAVVTGEGPALGPPLIDAVDFLTFTGSTRTGRIVAQRAAERLIGCSLELGGKNPMLVLDDASLPDAVEGAVRGCFVGAGQVCVSLERILVHRSIHDAFLERFVRRTRALRLHAGLDYAGDVGSLASTAQLERVAAHVRDAVDRGAAVAAGGRPRPDIGPCFYEPTILTGVRPGMLAYAEETFGPVVAVYPFDTIDEAVDRANDTPYGLNASVWTRSRRSALRVAARLDTGTVNVNEAYAATWGSVDAPIGGTRQSGSLRRNGVEGILKYTEAQTVAVQRGHPIAPPAWIGPEGYERAMSAAIRLLRRIPGLR